MAAGEMAEAAEVTAEVEEEVDPEPRPAAGAGKYSRLDRIGITTNPAPLTIATVGSQHDRLLHSRASYAICRSSLEAV